MTAGFWPGREGREGREFTGTVVVSIDEAGTEGAGKEMTGREGEDTRTSSAVACTIVAPKGSVVFCWIQEGLNVGGGFSAGLDVGL